MGLKVKELGLVGFRNMGERNICLSPSTTVLFGRNAAGKTNTVEALQMLTAGYSFRRPTPGQLIREGEQQARIAARLEGDGRVLDVSCDITERRRQFSKNGKKCQAADIAGTLMSVLFTPDDLSLVKRGAAERRAELDDFGRQANQGFSRVLANYTRSIEQRNRLLKSDECDQGLLDAWDASVALGGATLLHSRLRLFSRLAAKVSEVYGQIAPAETLECEYRCSLGDEAPGMTRDELRDLFLRRLAESRPEDLRRQQTCVGPHRDDVAFSICGRDARAFGSQGQQRSVVLALKMAEVLLAEEIVGEKPLLLLDDVMSELDEARRDAVAGFSRDGVQTVVTTTNLGYFSADLLKSAEVVRYGD